MITFPSNFDWGIASSAYQIEGGYDADGKGPNIWDAFAREPGRIAGGGTGEIGCGHYYRWKDDVKLIAELGVKSYRFSTSWSRIFPTGTGKVNPAGLDFYDRLVDGLLEVGVEPVVNLYHYDLPLALYEKGGWMNRDTAEAYVEYARLMFERLGDRVRRWITVNDVRGTLLGGYVTGERAPGRRGELPLAVQGWHIMNVACARAVEQWREFGGGKGEIGGVMGVLPVYPLDDSDESKWLADTLWLFYNDAFLSPILCGGYPKELLTTLEKASLMPEISGEDLSVLKRGVSDFIGISYYTPMRVAPKSNANFSNPMDSFERVVVAPVTASGWEIYPQGIYDTIMRIHNTYHPKIYIGETGGAFPDNQLDGNMVMDDDRISFLYSHFAQVKRAMDDGADVNGIHVWSLLDNFEWQQGFTKGFGLIRFDHSTLERYPKKSAYWYREVIENNGLLS